MKNVYVVRTAAIASLAAALLTAGWMSMQGDDQMQVMPESVSVSRAQVEPAVYFPAGFQIQPAAEDGAVHEYH